MPCEGSYSGKNTEVLFECLVRSFSLAIYLRVVGDREAECGTGDVEQFFLEGGQQSRIMVADDRTGVTMHTYDIVIEELC